MRRFGFGQLTPYSYPGGTIQGQVILEVDQPARARDLALNLTGRELSQATVSTGKSTERIVDQRVVLEQSYDLRPSLTFQDSDHVAPGSYTAPFSFTLPTSAAPSFSTSDYHGQGGLLSGRPDGMYVEYELEARLDVPWWVDAVAKTEVPIYSPRRVLGQLATLQSQPNPGHASIHVQPTSASPMVPGSPFSMDYQVSNPAGKHLRGLTVSIVRQVEYHVRSMSRVAHAPAFSAEVQFDGRDAQYTGQLLLQVPNVPQATGPWQGILFRTYWLASAVLDVELGFNVQVQSPLVPA
ncbi:MAG TPA: hypothetical protein VEY07_02615 [Thermoplasmata archaeon]|nr:hypothetical protein [Thermoplasmata archaeon]